MKELSNKTFKKIMLTCLIVILACGVAVNIKKNSYLTESTITKAVQKNLGKVFNVFTTRDNTQYSCVIWSHDYKAVMTGLRASFATLKKKENTGLKCLIFILKDPMFPEGSEEVEIFLLETSNLYSTDWEKEMSFDEFRKICNAEE